MSIEKHDPIPWRIPGRGLYEAPLRVVRTVNELAVRATMNTRAWMSPDAVIRVTARRIGEEINGERQKTMTTDDSLMFLSWWLHVTMEESIVNGEELIMRLLNEFRHTAIDLAEPEMESDGRDPDCDDCVHRPGRHWSEPFGWAMKRFWAGE